MSQDCKILIDRLKGGKVERVALSLDPTILGPDEKELQFHSKVKVNGEIYLTDDHLVVHLGAATKVKMPCSVCNQMIEAELKATNFYHTESLTSIGAEFNYGEALREALLIELPRTVECGGNCPERAQITPYLRSEDRKGEYRPFADLEDV